MGSERSRRREKSRLPSRPHAAERGATTPAVEAAGDRRRAWSAKTAATVFGIVFAIALALYWRTLAPTVAFNDSGELTVAAAQLGVAHPPGFPLWVLLTHLFTLLPYGTVASRANAASAFFTAGAAAFVALAAGELAFRMRRPRAAPVAALFAGLLFAVARTPWNYATVTEVYALNSLLIAAMLYCALARRWLLAASAFGLALGVHYVSAAFAFAGVVAVVAWGARRKELPLSAVVIAAGLLVYLQIPLAAHHPRGLSWSNAVDLTRVADHITGKEYRRFIGGETKGQLAESLRLLAHDLGVALLLSLAGLLALFRADRRAAYALSLVVAANLAWMAVYWIVNDRDAYLLPSIAALSLAAAAGVAALAGRFPRLAPVLLVIPIALAVVHFPLRDRSEATGARDFVHDAFGALPPNAILLTNTWQFYSPALYFQEVEHERPDVTVVDLAALQYGWYLDFLQRRVPTLARKEIDAFRPWVPRQLTTVAERSEYFNRLTDVIVAMTAAGRPAFATIDFALQRDPASGQAAAALARSRVLTPHGIVVEYSTSGTSPQPLALTLRPDAASDPEDVLVTEVRPLYAEAYAIRARYDAAAGRIDAALAAMTRATELDPENLALRHELANLQSMRR